MRHIDKTPGRQVNTEVSPFQAGRKTLADKYEYVMHGKLYKISEDKDTSDQKTKKVYDFFSLRLLMVVRQLIYEFLSIMLMPYIVCLYDVQLLLPGTYSF